MDFSIRAAVSVAALVWGASAAGAPGSKAITQYVHDVWRTEEGLPQNTVNTITQTRDGYLWVGTQDGLARFDGVRFVSFDTVTMPELGHSFVTRLFTDGGGRLWIGTSGGGLTRMEEGRLTRFTTEQGLPSEQISALFEDGQGRLWVGTDGGGLARLDEAVFTLEPSRQALGTSIRAIAEGDEGLWVGTEAGLALLRPDGTLTSFTAEQGLSRTSVRSLLRDRDGVLWIGTDHGLNRYEDGRFTVLTRDDGLTNDVIWFLHADDEGYLWIGTDGGGLNRLHKDTGEITAFTSRDGLSSDSVDALFEDREGNLWVGTNLGGLNRLRDGNFTTFTTREGLSYDYVRAVYEDREGTLWIGTEGGGVNRLKDGRFTAFTTRDGLSNDTVFSILEDRTGGLWFGTDNGLSRLAGGRFDVVHADAGLTNDSVLALHEDREGGLWIGTYAGGLNRLKDGRVTSFTTKEGLGSDTVNVIHEDRAGILWVGTRGGGLSRIEGGRVTTYTTKDGLSDDLVFSIHEDLEGSLWIGTYGGGLNRLKDGRFSAVTEKEGLFDDVVHRIIEDGRGDVWMSCNRGIFRVKKRELDEVADGTRERLVSVAYGTVDGMKHAECNGGANSGTMTKDGEIWFPTIQGVVRIDPERLETNPHPPPVVIEEVIVDNESVPFGGVLRLPAAARTLEIQYTAPSLVAPHEVRFRYRLEDLEEEWVEAEGRRTAYYSKLPPGEYRFRVIASNNDGVWNTEGVTLGVTVAPRFHETFWFRGLVVVFFALAGPLFHRYRVRRLTRQKAELERLVAERTAEVEAANARLAQLAREDGLTGVLNRRAFDATLVDECRRARRLRTPLSLVLLDVDSFKAYNDREGHLAGDACLRAVAQAVASFFQRAGERVARYGGDELVAILPGVARAGVDDLAEQLRERIVELAIPHPGPAAAPVVTVSIGVASAESGADISPEELVAAADRALYLAKERGRNRVEVSQETGVGRES